MVSIEGWNCINMSANSKIKARIGWQGLTKSEYLDSGFSYLVTGTDFKDGYIEWRKCHYVTRERFIQDSNIQLANEDVLITKDGTIGKVARVCGLDKPATLNSGIFLIRSINDEYCPAFLYYVLSSHIFTEFLDKLTAGSTIVHLYQKDIVHFNFYAPSLAEQTAISVALSDIDELIISLEKLIEKKKAIKQGTMQELLTGKKRLPGFDGEWEDVRLGDRCNVLRGGSPRPIQDYLTDDPNGINWIKIGDVKVGEKYIESTAERIIEAGVSMSREVFIGDFILSNSMSFGRPYILKINGCIHDGWLVIQNYQSDFDQQYLYYILGSSIVKEQYISMAAGSGVQNLNKDKVSNVILSRPEKNEQIAIAAILSDIDYEISKLEAKLNKYKQIKQGMMSELLTGKIRLI